MLKRILSKRNFSSFNKSTHISSKSFKNAFDLLNTKEYFRTLDSISKSVNLYNSKIEFLEDKENPNLALNYIRELNASKEYEMAYYLSKTYKKNFSVFNLKNRQIRSEFQKLNDYSREKLGWKMNRSSVIHNIVSCLAFLMLLYSEETLDLLFYFIDTTEEIVNKPEFQNSFIIKTLKEIYKKDGGNKEEITITEENKDEKNKKIHKDVFKKVMFDDVIGIDEFKDELMQIVDYLKYPEKYEEKGAYVPKGVLLVGSPGTGKTMLAQALANEANCSFIYKSGAEFDQIFVGSGSRNVRELFEKARKSSPAIIFIDEIDSVGGKRVDESNNTLNQLLVEIDGFRKDERIILVGATNLAESLDSALKRPGRFDKVINIPLPDIKGREKLFSYYLKKIKYDENSVTPSEMAKMTSGFSGAMIKNLVNQAICNAILHRKSKADIKDFREVFDKEFMGIRKKEINLDKERKFRSAVYEAGTAVASFLIKEATPLYKVSILPKGNKVKGAVSKPEGDQLSQNKEQIRSVIAVALSGRISEKIQFKGEMSTRSADDYQKASRIALAFTRKLAMVEESNLISADKEDLSDVYNSKLERDSVGLLTEIEKETYELLLKNKWRILRVADALVKKETLTKEEVKKIIGV